MNGREKRRERRQRILDLLAEPSFWDRVETAAAKLDTTPQMLRQRLLRGEVHVVRGLRVFDTGTGILGIRWGRRWLVHLPSPQLVAGAAE